MISCKRVPKPNGSYDPSIFESETFSKKRKKPPKEPKNSKEPKLDESTTIPRKPFHLRRRFPPLGSTLTNTPAPPTPPIPTSSAINATDEIKPKEITNGIRETINNGISKTELPTNNAPLQNTETISATNAPLTNAPTTPVFVEPTQPTNDVITKKPTPKKGKKKAPAKKSRVNTKLASPPKKYHIKFQNGHLTKRGQTTKKPSPAKLQMKAKKTKAQGRGRPKKAAELANLKTQSESPAKLKKQAESPAKLKKPAPKVQKQAKEDMEKLQGHAEEPKMEIAECATEKVYYKTAADVASPKKRPKSKLGNCVHCKKGVEMESVVICDAGCGTWFHASCSGYPKPLRESEYTMALCKKCLAENGLTFKDIHYFEEEYDIIQAWCKENEWTLQNIDNDGMCLFSSVFQWLDKETRNSRTLYRVENLVKGVTRELQKMITDGELPIILEFKANLMRDISGVLRSSHNLVSLWNSHYEGLGIGDYFIAAIEKFLKVGICIYHVLDGTVCVRQKSDLYSTTCNVVLRSEKYAAHYDLLLPIKNNLL